MTIKQTLKRIVLLTAVSIGLLIAAIPNNALATDTSCGTETAILSCKDVKPGGTKIEQTAVWSLLLQVLDILTAGVGVAAVGGVVYGAILYTSAGGNAEQVKKAREVIRNVVIGILTYALMYAALNFIIPGGVFSA